MQFLLVALCFLYIDPSLPYKSLFLYSKPGVLNAHVVGFVHEGCWKQVAILAAALCQSLLPPDSDDELSARQERCVVYCCNDRMVEIANHI